MSLLNGNYTAMVLKAAVEAIQVGWLWRHSSKARHVNQKPVDGGRAHHVLEPLQTFHSTSGLVDRLLQQCVNPHSPCQSHE